MSRGWIITITVLTAGAALVAVGLIYGPYWFMRWLDNNA